MIKSTSRKEFFFNKNEIIEQIKKQYDKKTLFLSEIMEN